MRTTSVTALVATHDRSDLAAAVAAALVAQLRAGDQLVVVGTAATDLARIGAALGDVPTGVEVLLLTSPAGKSSQLNAGVRRATGKVMVCTDDDVEVPDGWVDAMAAAIGGDVAIAFGPVVGISHAPDAVAPQGPPPGRAPTEPWVASHGAALAGSRRALVDVGGFDERLGPGRPVHGEEADLVLRLREAGWVDAIADAPTMRHVDWRTADQDAANYLVYERGAGAWLGSALRRRPTPATAKLALLRLRHQAGMARGEGRSLGFAVRCGRAFAAGVAAGLRFAPRPGPLAAAALAGHPRLRVLWVAVEQPDREQGGGNIRQANLVLGLAEHADVTLVVAAPLTDPAVRAACVEVHEVACPPLQPTSDVVRRVRSVQAILSRRWSTEQAFQAPARRALGRVALRLLGRHDVVVVQHQALAPLLPALRRRARGLRGQPVVLALQYAAAERARQEGLTSDWVGRRRALLDAEERHLRRLERWAAETADGLVAVSEDDLRHLTAGVHPDAVAPARIVPNGVDLERFAPAPLPATPTIVLTGSLHYQPNRDGALWFCDAVLPLVQAAVPDATLAIVGLKPDDEVLALAARPGVAVHGDVPSTLPYLHAARVAVVPLRVGTGTRLKALEALATGRALVGTSTGLEGLCLVDGVHARIADDAEGLAAAIVPLLLDPDLAPRLAAAGRAHVEARFGWGPIADDLLVWLEALSRA